MTPEQVKQSSPASMKQPRADDDESPLDSYRSERRHCLENIRAYAETGVDFISVGALTHSAKAADISMSIAAE